MLASIRHIIFFLSLIIMIGHDVVPHSHELDEAIELNHDFAHNEESSMGGLQHALSHYQHNAAEKVSELSFKIAKKSDVQKKAVAIYSIPPVEDGIVYYSNLKKQKFWEQPQNTVSLLDTSQTRRGPPSC